MTPTRRDFIRTAGLAGAGLTLGAGGAGASARLIPGSEAEPTSTPPSPRLPSPKRILILGGTGFIGPQMVRYAAERGHRVSIFTRGRTEADIPDVEHLIGDRNDDLSALEGREWDVVLDNNARDYRWVQLSTRVLRGSVEHYVFVSTISVYEAEAMGYDLADRIMRGPGYREESPRHRPAADFRDGDEAHYGLTKALGEDIVHEVFPGRTTIVRPGLIVGPDDPTDRFTYWPVRIDRGGEVLAPGNPDHANQVIDQRDLGEWIVRLAEDGTTGDFNATGPASRMSMAEMLYGIRAATSAPVRFTWVSEDFLQEHGVRPWSDLPSWIPGDPLMNVSIDRALAAGLTFRPLAVTVRDLLEWDRGRPQASRTGPPPGLVPDRERELLAEWHRRMG
jgi:2'-hydroxyisoflavone reductase